MQSDIALGYAGSYERLNTVSKKDAAILMSADCLIGDRYTIEFKTQNNTVVAWMVNKFNAPVGYFNPEVSRQLQIFHARGWVITALLSFVAYSDTPEPGHYWGEAALICYDPHRYDAAPFDGFINTVGKMMEDSIRPDVSLSQDGVEHILHTNGNWTPSARIQLPEKEVGMAVLKRRRSMSEKLIEQGRAGNKGCYAIGWIFIAVVVAALIIGAYFLLGALNVF